MYRGNSSPSLRNADREDDHDRDTVFSGMSNEVKHPLPPLPGSENGHENNGQTSGTGSNNTNTAGLGAGTPLPPSFSRGAQPQMAQASDSQRVSIAGQSTLASGSTPPLPPTPALIRSRTVGSRQLSDMTRVQPRAPRSDSSSLEKSPLDDHPMSPSWRELELGLHVSPMQINLAMPEGNDDGSGQGREKGVRPNISRSGTGLDWIIPQARQVQVSLFLDMR